MLIQEAVMKGAGVSQAARICGITLRTFQRWLKDNCCADRRKGPLSMPPHALSEAEQEAVLRLVNSPEYRNLSPEQAVAKAADNGTYLASERTIRRILKRHNQATYRERSKPATNTTKPRELVAFAPLSVLTWDITYLRNETVAGQFFYLYLFIDIWSRSIIGHAVHLEQSTDLAAQLLADVCSAHELAPNAALHSDNGAAMKGSTMLATMQALGIVKSFSRPSVSDDNPYIESLFRHLKYAPSYPRRGFPNIDEARAWVERFVEWYNTKHLHSAIAFVTPNERHEGRDIAILEHRRDVYAKARQHNPRRWTTSTRPWKRPTVVILNPDRIVETQTNPKLKAA
jgi:putative transposase